jgi:hypothetical protein
MDPGRSRLDEPQAAIRPPSAPRLMDCFLSQPPTFYAIVLFLTFQYSLRIIICRWGEKLNFNVIRAINVSIVECSFI